MLGSAFVQRAVKVAVPVEGLHHNGRAASSVWTMQLTSGPLAALCCVQDEMVGSGLLQLIKGRFKEEGSLQRALELVSLGGGIDK
jgi:hypothetical protein